MIHLETNALSLQVLVLWDAAASRLTEYPAFLQPVVDRLLLPVARQLGFRADWPSHRAAADVGETDQSVCDHSISSESDSQKNPPHAEL